MHILPFCRDGLSTKTPNSRWLILPKKLPRFEEKAARFFAAEVGRWNGEPLEILHSPLPIGEVPTPFMAPNVAVPKKFFSTETSLIDS